VKRLAPQFMRRGMLRLLATASLCGFVVATLSGPARADVTTSPSPHIGRSTTSVGPHGYWLAGSDGGVFSFGSAQFFGSAADLHLQSPIVGITPTPDRGGYWLVASDGGVFSFGDADFYGSIPGLGIAPVDSPSVPRLNAPIVGMVSSRDGGGYYLLGADGGVFTFGDAKYEGSCPALENCSSGAATMMIDGTGNGYWVVAYDGDVYAFGDATAYGGPAAYLPYATEVLSAVPTPSGNGYWILFSDGEIYTFGDAAYLGSPFGQIQFSNPASAIYATADGGGYWVTTSNGKVYAYGDAPNDGGVSSLPLNGLIVGATGS
jgi:hypothetical protein